MASTLNADVIIPPLHQGNSGKLAQIMVRRNNLKDGIKLDIKIMLLGDNRAGKSTLVSNLCYMFLIKCLDWCANIRSE